MFICLRVSVCFDCSRSNRLLLYRLNDHYKFCWLNYFILFVLLLLLFLYWHIETELIQDICWSGALLCVKKGRYDEHCQKRFYAIWSFFWGGCYFSAFWGVWAGKSVKFHEIKCLLTIHISNTRILSSVCVCAYVR